MHAQQSEQSDDILKKLTIWGFPNAINRHSQISDNLWLALALDWLSHIAAEFINVNNRVVDSPEMHRDRTPHAKFSAMNAHFQFSSQTVGNPV